VPRVPRVAAVCCCRPRRSTATRRPPGSGRTGGEPPAAARRLPGSGRTGGEPPAAGRRLPGSGRTGGEPPPAAARTPATAPKRPSRRAPHARSRPRTLSPPSGCVPCRLALLALRPPKWICDGPLGLARRRPSPPQGPQRPPPPVSFLPAGLPPHQAAARLLPPATPLPARQLLPQVSTSPARLLPQVCPPLLACSYLLCSLPPPSYLCFVCSTNRPSRRLIAISRLVGPMATRFDWTT
jgi:hypothetical protein